MIYLNYVSLLLKKENWQEISKKYFESGQLDDAELMDAYNKARKEDRARF